MQSSKFLAYAIAGVMAVGLFTTTESKAYDPCQRALQELQEAEALVSLDEEQLPPQRPMHKQ